MSITLAYLFVTFFVFGLVSLFYWQVVRVAVIQALRYRLFARRDNLRRMAILRQEDPDSFSYCYLEDFLCKSINLVPRLSLVTFFFYALRGEPSPESERFRKEASPNLTALRDTASQDCIIMMAVNSPIFMFIAVCAALILWLSGRITRMLLITRTETFVVAEGDDPVLELQPV